MNWIKCSDKMPELYIYVLVFADNKVLGDIKPYCIARWNGDRWGFVNADPLETCCGAWVDIEYPMDTDDVTHWMPLPKPPEE